MRVFVNKQHYTVKKVIKGLILLYLMNAPNIHCLCQSIYSQVEIGKNDTVVYLPLYTIGNKTLSDSIESAIVRLESNGNYYEEYGYVLVLDFVTIENPDSLKILISISSIRWIFPLVTYRPTEYHKIIGCAKKKGYLIIIDAWSFVSREEISHWVKRTNDTMRFELTDCRPNSIFCPWPFHQMSFWIPLQNKNNFVPPNEWHKYKKKIRE